MSDPVTTSAAWSGPTLAPDDTGCYGWPRTCEHYDDLACLLDVQMRDPDFAAAYIEAGRRHERAAPGYNRPVAIKPAFVGRRHGW